MWSWVEYEMMKKFWKWTVMIQYSKRERRDLFVIVA